MRGPIASSSRFQIQDIPIDPTLVPLPNTADDNISNPLAIAKSRGYSAAEKVAGKRRKNGKQRADDVDELSSRKRKHIADADDDIKPSKKGRPQGSGNYSQDDLKALLDLTEAELPLGQRGWKVIHVKFVQWARKHKRPERALKSLETKFKQVCFPSTKLTGVGECPPQVQRAHEIEYLINERAGTRDLDDDDFDASNDDDNNTDDTENHSHISISSDGDDDPPPPRLSYQNFARILSLLI
jgi:hypothetical protein